jgi:2-C-methyl-D-erythritol 2,4-cyclodiphosphate synthase
LVKGRPLIIGGVEIAYEYGLQGHSDADVLLHAIMDAVLGALGEGDIGHHFPDSDVNLSGVDSRKLLRQVAMLMASRGYQVGNIDATIIAQQPRMAEHLGAMCDNIASDLATHKNLINVKATTTEKLGYEGKGLGIAAQAVCLLSNS